MKKLTKIAAPLALVVLLATGGVSACTADENPTPETTTAGTSTQDVTSAPANIVFGRVTPISGAGVLEIPSYPGLIEPNFLTSDDSSIVFMSSDTSLPGGNGRNQIYRWTPEFGVLLVTNVGIDPSKPVGAQGDSVALDMNDVGDIVFLSNANDLPGGTGQDQIYLGASTGELTPIFVVDHEWGPTGQEISYSNSPMPYQPKISNDGSIVFRAFVGGDSGLEHFLIYRWTATDGVALICDMSIPRPKWSGDSVIETAINSSGSFVFWATSLDLPGGNGEPQVYLWTAADGIVLITNVGTPTEPIGVDMEAYRYFLRDDGSILLTSDGLGLPGANGYLQAYLWTATSGITLLSNAGTAQQPIGANDDSGYFQNSSQGSLTFVSRATNLPGGNGYAQIYLWTPSDGVTLIANAGTTQTPVGADSGLVGMGGSRNGHRYRDLNTVVFSSRASNLPCGDPDRATIYLWTAASGITPITDAGTAEAPICAPWDASPVTIRSDNSVVFLSNSPDLPGAPAPLDHSDPHQLYVWTPLR